MTLIPTLGLIVPPAHGRVPDDGPRLYAGRAHFLARGLGIDGFHATTSGAPFLEVGPVGVTKAAALARLCDRWCIDPADVVAFGDNLNDVEMLRFAGLGVAMGNAEPEAVAAADRVTLTNNEDGVAAVIETLL